MAKGDVKINIAPLNDVLRQIRALRSGGGGNGPLEGMLIKWGARYQAAMRRRFLRFARGGGDWRALKKRTTGLRKKPRKGRKKKPRKHAILIDTGTLIGALKIGGRGAVSKKVPNGIIVGFGGAKHPGKKGGGGRATIATIAKAHQVGSSKRGLPRREILVQPDTKVVAGFLRDAKVAFNRMLADAERKKGH